MGMNSCGRKKVPNWEWKDYLKDTDWFASICNLPSPSKGLIPEAIPDKLVSKSMLNECFEERGGSQGYKWNPSKVIPVTEVRELVPIVDGGGNVIRNRVSTALAKGIYADRILGLSVNWALYAHKKHKHQLLRAWNDGLPSPHVSPLLRVPIRYNPPPPLNLKGDNGFKRKKTPTGSEFLSHDTRFSPSTEPGACKLGAKVFVSCNSLKTDADDTNQWSSETVPVERKATSHDEPEPDDMRGFDRMHAPETFRAANPPGISEDLRSESLVKQILLSMVTSYEWKFPARFGQSFGAEDHFGYEG
ncbi:hypothetical protein R1sor_008236 [Riccia sorocarpa]|uniref:Uncharacterized protein n=1 Tax=Riccia sorocarpa TaxID=122646 RepID=A0ABD3HWE8_9MARC